MFFKKKYENFFQALVNIFIFLPYYFSVLELTKTLFAPWKNLIIDTKQSGFSFESYFQKLSFNIVSRLVGAIARFTILFAYLFTTILYIISIPFLFLFFTIYCVFAYAISLVVPNEEQKKKNIHDYFVKNHLLNPENAQAVEEWFKSYYEIIHKNPWWDKKNLFAVRPLACDWTYGYTPTMDQFCIDLTNNINKTFFFDREKELEKISQILTQYKGANIILVGEQGVGRRSIIESLAYSIAIGKCIPMLAYKRILVVDIDKILSLSEDFIKRSEIVSLIFQEAASAKNCILVIYDIDRYTATSKDRIDITPVLQKFAQNPFLHIIGTSIPANYQKYVYSNSFLRDSFETLEINELDSNQTLKILLELVFSFEKKYSLSIPYETAVRIVELAENYIQDIPQPEKSIHLMDSVCSYAFTERKNKLVLPEYADYVIQEKTHIPTMLTAELSEKLLNLENNLNSRVIEQKEAIKKVSACLKKSFVITTNRKRPLASFLFLGPTGVGKTETAKALTDFFFGNQTYLIRFDMSNFQTKLDIPHLIGDPNTGDPGLLTKSVRARKYGVLLLDEIEKADSDLLNIFLTILDEGYFTNGAGERVDCKNLIIIATSNAGAEYLFNKFSEGNSVIVDSDSLSNELIEYCIEQNYYSPEFLNRFDGVVVYLPLTPKALEKIALSTINKIQKEVFEKHKIRFYVRPELLSYLVQKGYDPRFGARNLDRVIRDELEDKIATSILTKKVLPGGEIQF